MKRALILYILAAALLSSILTAVFFGLEDVGSGSGIVKAMAVALSSGMVGVSLCVSATHQYNNHMEVGHARKANVVSQPKSAKS